jgi:hypothetical protein
MFLLAREKIYISTLEFLWSLQFDIALGPQKVKVWPFIDGVKIRAFAASPLDAIIH